MGHQIGKRHNPRRGSLMYWPRKRAKRIYSRVRNWPSSDEIKPLGFAGYKAGMTHIIAIDNRKTSPTKGEEIQIPCTVIETPSLFVFGLRFYKKTPSGFICVCDILSENISKEFKRKTILPKKRKKKIEDIKGFDDIKLLAHTKPKEAGVKRKKPEIFEVGVGGKEINKKTEFCRNLIGKEIKVSEVFKEGQQIDVISVSKGKGFQGPVKRFGVKLLSHKAEKARRKPGSYGPEGHAKLTYRAVMPGQLGYNTRVEYNKQILRIDSDGKNIIPKGDFINYGLIKSDYIIIAGSVPGPRKRLIRLRHAMRPSKKIPPVPPTIVYVSKESKQGC